MRALPAALLSLVAAAACSKGESWAITDTEGRQVRITCPEGNCQPVDGGVPLQLMRSSYLQRLCPGAPGTPPDPRNCRALACQKDADCAPASYADSGTCLDRRCIEPSQQLRLEDALAECLAGTGTWAGTSVQVDRDALARQCGNPCRIPGPCQPK